MATDTVGYLVAFVIFYLALNIVGTVFYMRLKEEDKTVGLVTVIIGWFLFPIVNIYSPIRYSQYK